MLLSSGVFRGGGCRSRARSTCSSTATGAPRRRRVAHRRRRRPSPSPPTASPTPRSAATGSRAAADAPPPLLADSATQVLLASPRSRIGRDARAAAVVGFGSGMLVALPARQPGAASVTTIEIEPAMVEAARQFYPANRRAFDDPRVARSSIDDAKSFFAAAPQPFDLILSEPSNPWVSGVASLFGGEFYESWRASLRRDGVFAPVAAPLRDQRRARCSACSRRVHRALRRLRRSSSSATATCSSSPPSEARCRSRTGRCSRCRRSRQTSRASCPSRRETLESTRFLDRAAPGAALRRSASSPTPTSSRSSTSAPRRRASSHGCAAGFISLSAERFALAAPFVERRPLATETATPVTGDPLFERRARAARLRAALRERRLQRRAGRRRPMRHAGYRLWQWHMLSPPTGRRPTGAIWVADTVAVEADLHVGSAGEVDERFYARCTPISTPGRAAAGPRRHAFVEALARWDYRRRRAARRSPAARCARRARLAAAARPARRRRRRQAAPGRRRRRPPLPRCAHPRQRPSSPAICAAADRRLHRPAADAGELNSGTARRPRPAPEKRCGRAARDPAGLDTARRLRFDRPFRPRRTPWTSNTRTR